LAFHFFHPGKQTEDGYLVYTEEELGMNKEGGGVFIPL